MAVGFVLYVYTIHILSLFQELIRDVDSVLYVDTDMLFLSPVENLWRLFKNFNSTQLAGVAVEGEDKATGWYNRFARHPFYGELGWYQICIIFYFYICACLLQIWFYSQFYFIIIVFIIIILTFIHRQ